MVRRCVVALLCCLLITPPSHAWNDVGHSLIGMIAYAQLSPAERAKVMEILKKHPHYAEYLTAERPSEMSPEEWAFARAGNWADSVRGTRGLSQDEYAKHPKFKFHRSNWHYINYVYKPKQTDFVLGKPLSQTSDILRELQRSADIASGKETKDPGIALDVSPEQNRAVRLTWLFHLVGDEHQPLHVTALVNERFPKGDEGGNLHAVRRSAGEPPIKLHAYWDNLLGKDIPGSELRTIFLGLADDPALQPEKLAELASHKTYESWAQESYETCGKVVYLNGELPLAPWTTDDREQSNPAWIASVPAFNAEQRQAARDTARRRVVLAGYRLAEQLKQVVK